MGMRPDIKTRWVDALRSGRYPQTTGALRRNVADEGRPVGYCCLGVLCDLAADAGVIQRGDTGYRDPDVNRLFDETALLPPAVVRWAGLASSYALEWRDEDDNPNTLASLNDNGGTFDDIADRIEENL